MKALLRAILTHRREMAAVAECAGHPCPLGGVREARERVERLALDLPHVEAWLAWVEAVEATEAHRRAALADPTVPLAPLARLAEREAHALARLRSAVAGRP